MLFKSMFVIFCLILFTSNSESAGVVARRRQMMEQQKAAYIQAMQQQQIQAATQQQAMYNQAMQQKTAQQQQQQAAQQQAAQQQAAQMQAQQAAQQENLNQQKAQRNALQSAQTKGWEAEQQENTPQATQITSLEAVWNEMSASSNVWNQMMDREPKELTVKRYIELFAQQGVYIRKSAAYYVDMIDDMANANPDMLQAAFRDVLRIVAILEYDFDNGQDREELVKQVLGQGGYSRNLERIRQNNSKVVY